MTQNSIESPHYDDELDFRKIVTNLIESKNIIIPTILIFTIASIFYAFSLKPSFNSSVMIEVGYFEKSDGTQELFESPKELNEDLKLNLQYKDNTNVSIKIIGDRLIRLETSSLSAEINEKLLNKYLAYIIDRHTKISKVSTNYLKNQISNEIKLYESEISQRSNLTKIDIEKKIKELTNNLPIINDEIMQLEELIIAEGENLQLVKEDNKMKLQRAALSPTLEQIIYSYKNKINLLNREKNSNLSQITALSQKIELIANSQYSSDAVFELFKRKRKLEDQLELLNNQIITKTLPMKEIETLKINPKVLLTIFSGFILGMIIGIFIMITRNFIKSYSDNKI